MGILRVWPSTIGLRARWDWRIAFSTACTSARSHTCTDSMRGSGTEMLDTWLSGMGEP
jgi:hypothetical protein